MIWTKHPVNDTSIDYLGGTNLTSNVSQKACLCVLESPEKVGFFLPTLQTCLLGVCVFGVFLFVLAQRRS